MTEEELKNKCRERAKIFQQAMESCKSTNPIDCIEWFADRIAELEKENAELKTELKDWKDEWQEQVQKATDEGWERTKLTGRVRELEQQIEKMKCYENCNYSESSSCLLNSEKKEECKGCQYWRLRK